MLTKYTDLDKRVRVILAQQGDAASIDRCHDALRAEGVTASRATVGRAVMRVREEMQFEALTAELMQADEAAQSGRGEAPSGESYVHAFERAVGELVDKVSAVAQGLNVTTAQELLTIAKVSQAMVKMLIDSREVIGALQAIEDKKAENRKQIFDRVKFERERLESRIEVAKRLRKFKQGIKEAAMRSNQGKN